MRSLIRATSRTSSTAIGCASLQGCASTSWSSRTVWARTTPPGISHAVGAEILSSHATWVLFMDQAAEPVPSQDPDIRAQSRRKLAPGGRALAERPVRAMDVLVIDVLAQDQLQVPVAGDQHPVQALAPGPRSDAPSPACGRPSSSAIAGGLGAGREFRPPHSCLLCSQRTADELNHTDKVTPAHPAGRQPGPIPANQCRRRRSSCQLEHHRPGLLPCKPGPRPPRRRRGGWAWCWPSSRRPSS